MYRYVWCQTHSECPDLKGWYVVVEPDDFSLVAKLHKGITHVYYHKFGLDPHLQKSEIAGIYNPVRLGANWFNVVFNFLMNNHTLIVNSVGGWLPLDSVTVFRTVESSKLVWPDTYDDEVITISRWPEGVHWYLASNKDRIFTPPRFVQYKDALAHAKLFTERIETKDC